MVFLGARLKKKLFSGMPAVGESVRIDGVRYTVIGTMDMKFSDSCYFNCDDESAFIPYTAAADMWDARYASVMVFEPVAPEFEAPAMAQFRTAIANRQHFSPTDKRAITMFGRQEFKPIYEGITLGIEGLLFLIGAMTLGIGGVGVMNIMLVSVDERVREIGLRRALGARKTHIRWQFLLEALVLTLAAGAIGMLLSWILTSSIGTLPFLGPAYEDDSGKVDIHLKLSVMTMFLSTVILSLSELSAAGCRQCKRQNSTPSKRCATNSSSLISNPAGSAITRSVILHHTVACIFISRLLHSPRPAAIVIEIGR